MDDLYRENILDHYKHPHNFTPPAPELPRVDLEFHDLNPLCGDELTVQLLLDDDDRVAGHPLLRPWLRDLAGRRLDGLRRGQGHAHPGAPGARSRASSSTCSGSTSPPRG